MQLIQDSFKLVSFAVSSTILFPRKSSNKDATRLKAIATRVEAIASKKGLQGSYLGGPLFVVSFFHRPSKTVLEFALRQAPCFGHPKRP